VPGEPTDDHTDFRVYEYKSDEGAHMLVVQESC
jgi:hypothetical protein